MGVRSLDVCETLSDVPAAVLQEAHEAGDEERLQDRRDSTPLHRCRACVVLTNPLDGLSTEHYRASTDPQKKPFKSGRLPRPCSSICAVIASASDPSVIPSPSCTSIRESRQELTSSIGRRGGSRSRPRATGCDPPQALRSAGYASLRPTTQPTMLWLWRLGRARGDCHRDPDGPSHATARSGAVRDQDLFAMN